jgi:hypothetical protein
LQWTEPNSFGGPVVEYEVQYTTHGQNWQSIGGNPDITYINSKSGAGSSGYSPTGQTAQNGRAYLSTQAQVGIHGTTGVDTGSLGMQELTSQNKNERQVVQTRPRPGEKIVGGFFRLSFDFAGLNGFDPESKTVTPKIDWNADAPTVQAAIQTMENVGCVYVRRNDKGEKGEVAWEIEFTADILPDGPAEGPLLCPSSHNFYWKRLNETYDDRVENETRTELGGVPSAVMDGFGNKAYGRPTTINAGDMPLFAMYTSRFETEVVDSAAQLEGVTSGATSAPQVVAAETQKGMRKNEMNLCATDGTCSYTVPGLASNKWYRLRVRARNDVGWSPFKESDPMLSVPEPSMQYRSRFPSGDATHISYHWNSDSTKREDSSQDAAHLATRWNL